MFTQSRHLESLDWFTIAMYAVGMLAIGWYYSRRARTADDYLLGGRAMRPWIVGISLFASLCSVVSFVAMPGEIIRHGPMISCEVLTYPLIIPIVGWLIIPLFMKQKVTSAYEILELRLGLSVRLLGSLLFLSLRLLWMAVIVYTAATKVLVPVLGLDPALAPCLCVVVGVITVCYTSMGGLRAVVVTDAIQAFLLFGAAGATIVLISVHLGGVDGWWPRQWAPNWDPLTFWFDPNARLSVASVALSSGLWYICTAGSDQLAIQRYLATRDAPAARRMYIVSMVACTLVSVFMVMLGFAVLAYYRANPRLLGGHETIADAADQLFLRFIVQGMPSGVTGLVVAGLVAAAMSALSAGLNSTCSVITVDLVERFRQKRSDSERQQARLARGISWIVGIAVVALSLLVGTVSGNLLEVAGKVINLLVGPLAVLFFMAMFVPWATVAGTIAAAVASVAVAVAIAFFQLAGLSFIWILPASLGTGIVVGAVASLLPVPRRAATLAKTSLRAKRSN
jgi:solute:Na+ symporter, SSS family